MQRSAIHTLESPVARSSIDHTDHTRLCVHRLDAFLIAAADSASRQSVLETAACDLQRDLDAAHAQNDALSAKIYADDARLQSLELTLKSVHNRLADAISQRDFLQVDFEHSQDDLKMQRARAMEFHYDFEDSCKAYAALEKEFHDLRSALSAVQAEREDFREAQSQLASILRECGAKDYLSVISQHFTQQADLEDLRSLKEDLERARSLLSHKHSELSDLQFKQVTFHAQIAELEIHVRKLQSDKERLEGERTRLQAMLDIAQNEVKVVAERYESSLTKWHEESDRLESELDSVSAHADNLSVKIDTLSDRNAELSTTVQYLRREVSIQKSIVRSRDRAVEALRTQVDMELDEQKTELALLEGSAEAEAERAEELQHRLEERDQEIAHLRALAQALTQRLDNGTPLITVPMTPETKKRGANAFPLTPPTTPFSPLSAPKFTEDVPDTPPRPYTPTPFQRSPSSRGPVSRPPIPFAGDSESDAFLSPTSGATSGFSTPKTPARKSRRREDARSPTPTSRRRPNRKLRTPSGANGTRRRSSGSLSPSAQVAA